MRIMVRVTPFRSEIHKPKWGWLHMGERLAFGGFWDRSEIAGNADADMRGREMLAFENTYWVWWRMVEKCGL